MTSDRTGRVTDRPPVLYVLPSGAMLRGGARSNLLLIEHLERFQPHVLTLRGSSVAEECRRLGIPVHEADTDARADLSGRVWRWERLAAYTSLIRAGRAVAACLRPRIVQADYEHFPVAFGIRCGRRMRTVVYVRGSLIHGVHRRALAKFLAADAIIVLTRAIREDIISASPASLRRSLAEKIRVVHNSVPAKSSSLRRPHSACVAVVGAIEPRKRQLELLAEWFRRRETRGITLQVIGQTRDSEYTARCRTLVEREGAQHQIDMTGFQSDMTSRYRGLDVLVCVSYAEGSPRTIIEAASHGVPAVSFAFRGVEEAVVSGTTGLVCGSMPDVVDAVLHLLGDPKLRDDYGCAARAHVREHFDPCRTAQEVEAIYQPLVTSQRA